MNPLTKHMLRRCRTDGNVRWLDALTANFSAIISDRGGMVISTGSGNGQSYSFSELQGYSVAAIIAAKEEAYGLFAELDNDGLARLLDRSVQRKTRATFQTSY